MSSSSSSSNATMFNEKAFESIQFSHSTVSSNRAQFHPTQRILAFTTANTLSFHRHSVPVNQFTHTAKCHVITDAPLTLQSSPPLSISHSVERAVPVPVWRLRHRSPVVALSWQRGWLVAADAHANASALAEHQIFSSDDVDVVPNWFPAQSENNKRSFAPSDVAVSVLSADRFALAVASEQAVDVIDFKSAALLRRWIVSGVPRAVAEIDESADGRLAVADDDSMSLFDLRSGDRAPTDRIALTVGANIQAIDSRDNLVLLGDSSRAVALLDVRKLSTPVLKANAVTKYGIAGVRIAPFTVSGPTRGVIVASDEGEVVAIDGARSDVVRADGVLMGFHIDGDGNFFALSERGTLLSVEHWFAPGCCAVPAKVRQSRFKEEDQ